MLLRQAKGALETQIIQAQSLLGGCDMPVADDAEGDEEFLRQIGEGFGLD